VEFATMLILGLGLSIAAVGFLCWLLFTLAIYALPVFAGFTAGLAAYHTGAGVVGGAVIAVLAGGATLALGQFGFGATRSPLARVAVGLLFVLPAVAAGYQATHGLAHIGNPSEAWRQAFAIAGGLAVGAAAWARIARIAPSGATAPALRWRPPSPPAANRDG
jgi:hypothetical protein